MRCQTNCRLQWRANMCSRQHRDRLSISIGVTRWNCHANALQSFQFIGISFDYFSSFNSQIKTWIFIFDAFHFFNRYPIKYSDFLPFYFCFFFETNIHLTFIFYSLKLSESEQWTRMNGKKSLIKILQCIGIDPQQSLKVWHITTKLPTAIRNIRSILPN